MKSLKDFVLREKMILKEMGISIVNHVVKESMEN